MKGCGGWATAFQRSRCPKWRNWWQFAPEKNKSHVINSFVLRSSIDYISCHAKRIPLLARYLTDLAFFLPRARRFGVDVRLVIAQNFADLGDWGTLGDPGNQIGELVPVLAPLQESHGIGHDLALHGRGH